MVALFRLAVRCCAPALLATVMLGADPSPASPPAVLPTPRAFTLSRIPPVYPVPYPPASEAEIRAVLERIHGYLEQASGFTVVDRDTGATVTALAHPPPHVALVPDEFLLSSYEWGVTYAGMLLAAQVTGDARYRDYTARHLLAIAVVARLGRNEPPVAPDEPPGPPRLLRLRGVIAPRSLDDSGAMATAMIKASRAGVAVDELRPWIDNYLAWITTGQLRLADGTLARNRPHPHTLWLDDLYMSVPALAQMGVLTGEARYFDDAVRQVRQFSQRMFVPGVALYRHGWVEGMEPHPAFHWARANGWALVAMAELLSVLPENHPGRAEVLAQYREHARGIVAVQGATGLWHQLLDRPDSYLETSASAMFTYALARGINRGWLDRLAYGPAVSLAWNAVAQKVNARGQVEGTCVGTGMGFDPAFYYYRPVSPHAAHGYGPVLLAGAEMIALRRGPGAAATVNDGAVQFAPSPSRY
ncbi:MAG: glycoside hydrolase family 88 protein [Verrucomicrobia bacterium]|nr:glycoside hydrolase family 88 protein [Verrucomicrobiota bacterium]